MSEIKSQMSARGLFGRLWTGKERDPEADMDGVVGTESIAPEEALSESRPSIDASAIPPEELERLSNDVIAALKTVYDPEIPADIYELGLIYKIDIEDDRSVKIDMTLTAPGCPVAGEMPGWVENAVATVPGVQSVKVAMVFDPPWDQSRMSDEARVALDMW
jgi:FeS assembly SUF system protein